MRTPNASQDRPQVAGLGRERLDAQALGHRACRLGHSVLYGSAHDPLLAAAAMDCLLEGAHTLVIEGASCRNPPPDRRKRTAPSHPATAAANP